MSRDLRRAAARTAAAVVVLAALAGVAPAAGGEGLAEHPHRLPQGVLFAHALGAVDGVTYSNSLEAFEASYARGARYFELDLSFTADGELVCFHRGLEHRIGLDRPIGEITATEFLTLRFEGRYTLMTLERFFELMAQRPDVLLITDTKDDFRTSLEAVVATAARVDPALTARIIPQFYQAGQWRDVAEVEDVHGLFASAIFTLYNTNLNDDGVVDAAAAYRIPVVTMSTGRFNRSLVARLAAEGVASMVHTVNGASKVRPYLEQGVLGAYTDFVYRWWPLRAVGRAAPAGPPGLTAPAPTQ